MMWTILHHRPDGTFVIERSGHPYHVTADDPLFQDVAAAAEGITLPPEPQPPMPAPLTPEQVIAGYQAQIDGHVDAVARQRKYRDGVLAASYAASTNAQWAAEAAAFIAWRDGVWAQALATLAQVQAGAIEPPDPAAFIASLPVLVWP